ncbi:DMT family transporter [Mycolicibacterium gilvum]|uniref:Cation/cationic drug transporter n=1 Tax=Mycolicibacterium gilvum (strain DSM 45189 / LMG 24558 / Spyr1) TaxID=278137 RepID=E6TP84_MYCSR|nr:SMR family transporter [Mycolicibacterium gilvum]ADT99517.1 cation/cationic drug transporter [Mycolicibacterium gilvum Spyr1]
MIEYVLLIAAIGCEVSATLALRVAARGKTSFYGIVLIGYVAAFTLLWASLRHGMPLGVAYGIWAAAGVALTAAFSRLLFDEPLTRKMLGGIALIMVGVLLVEIGASH